MNPLDTLGDKLYRKLTKIELIEVEEYIIKTYGQKVGMRIIRLADNIGWSDGKELITAVAVFNRAVQYYRRQRV
jgi:hypothetical protein